MTQPQLHAAVLTAYGSAPDYQSLAEPAAGPGQTVITVTAAPIVPLDLLCATGASYFGQQPLPYVPGVQGVGIVTRSTRFDPGARVFFTTKAGMTPGDGSLAQRCVVPDAAVLQIDETVPDAEVAAIGLSGVAAWMALSWRANLQPGETVIVLGASGAVGQAAIGAARVLGAGRVIAVCRSERAELQARNAGPDQVVRMPETDDPAALAEALRSACAGPADVVLDPIFGYAAAAASTVLSDGGRLVNLGGSGGDLATFSSALLRSRSASVLGYTNNSLTPEQTADALTAVLREAAAGRISVRHDVLPLADCAEGWYRTAGGGSSRIVLVP